jgi:hypothetical protein
MNLKPACASCKHWEREHKFTEGGYCYRYKMHSYYCEICDKHEQVKIEPPQPGTITLSGPGAKRWKEIYSMSPPPEGVELS